MNLIKTICAVLLIGSCAYSCKPKQQQATAPAIVKLPTLSAADNKAIIDREISTWEFAKLRNLAALREILADDYVGYFGKSTVNPNQVVQQFQTSTVRSYRMSNIRTKAVTDDVAIIYYNLYQDIVDQDGDAWTPDVASSSTYVRRNGKWYSVFYQETVL